MISPNTTPIAQNRRSCARKRQCAFHPSHTKGVFWDLLSDLTAWQRYLPIASFSDSSQSYAPFNDCTGKAIYEHPCSDPWRGGLAHCFTGLVQLCDLCRQKPHLGRQRNDWRLGRRGIESLAGSCQPRFVTQAPLWTSA